MNARSQRLEDQMTWKHKGSALLPAAALMAGVLLVGHLHAQVGKSLGVVDVNIALEKDLATMPG